MVKSAPLTLLAVALAALTLIPLLSGAMSATPVAPSETSVAVDAPAATCGPVWDEATALTSSAYHEAAAILDGEAGYVDLFWMEGFDHTFVALFDLDARGDLVLPADFTIDHVAIQMRGERFQTLIAPLGETDAMDPPLIPVGCSNRISPGMRVSTPVGGCSLNFIFRDQFGRWYAGTAGHCFSGLGQAASIPFVGHIGTSIYRINGGIGNDFALIRIDDDKVQFINPAMCHWGGPTGEATGAGGLVRHYGYPVVWGELQYTRPRTAQGQGGNDNSFTVIGLVASGDSGSGARLDNGEGLGILTHVNMGFGLFAHSAPNGFGTKLTRGIALAEAATGLDFTLQTAPVA